MKRLLFAIILLIMISALVAQNESDSSSVIRNHGVLDESIRAYGTRLPGIELDANRSPYGFGSASGLLGRFGLKPETSRAFSTQFFSNGNQSGYIASYLHSMRFTTTNWGRLDLGVEIGQFGTTKTDGFFFAAPKLRWQLKKRNFQLNIQIEAPPIRYTPDGSNVGGTHIYK